MAVLLGACNVSPVVPQEERPVLARVAGMPIYLDDFIDELHRMQPDAGQGLPAAGEREAQRRALLEDMIDRRLARRQAENNNIVVGLDEIDASYSRVRQGWPEEHFERELVVKDISPVQLKRQLRELLMIRRYFRDHVFSRVAVTDQEIEAFLDVHPEKRLVPEQVRAFQIVVKTQDDAKAILRELKRDLSFEDAAMKHSLSPEGKIGGDLGYFSRGVMPSVFDEVCFSLRVGEISRVVASDYGFHIFRVVDKQPALERPINELRDVIEAEMRRDRELSAQRATLKELRDASIIEIKADLLAHVH